MEGTGARRVVVSGATGFVGWNLVHELLARGVQVVALHRRKQAPAPVRGLSWLTFDGLEQADLRADALVHAAAVRHRHGVPPDVYLSQNVALTDRLLAAARGRVRRFVAVSSIAVYGWPGKGPIDESFPFAPEGPYGGSKVESESRVRRSGIPYAVVRPSITYGLGDTGGFVDKLLHLVSRGRYLVVGKGTNRLQLVHVADLAVALAETAVRPGLDGAEFICTYRDPIELSELSRLASLATGRSIPPVHVPLPLARLAALGFDALDRLGIPFPGGEPPVTREKLAMVATDRSYRIDRMRSYLGWDPPTGYEEGLRRTAAPVTTPGSPSA